MQKCHLHFPAVIGNRHGEQTRVLVVHMDEIDAIVGSKSRQPEPLPLKQIPGNRKGNPRAHGRKRGIGHDVTLEWLDEGNARILAAAALRVSFVISFRLERDAQPFDVTRIACLVKFDARDSNPRIVALRDEPGKEVEVSVRATGDPGIENALDLLRVARLRLHQHCQPVQLERKAHAFSKQAEMASITRFVSWGSRTRMERAPASLAG